MPKLKHRITLKKKMPILNSWMLKGVCVEILLGSLKTALIGYKAQYHAYDKNDYCRECDILPAAKRNIAN